MSVVGPRLHPSREVTMIKPERSRRGFTLIEWFALGTRGNGEVISSDSY